MARESTAPNVDGANDYVAIFTPETELDPARVCLVIVDVQYATGSPPPPPPPRPPPPATTASRRAAGRGRPAS